MEKGLLQDLTSRWQSSQILANSRFYPLMREAAQFNGKYYGIPYDFNAEVWFLNLDWINARGVDVPQTNWTVKDLTEMALKLTDLTQGVYATTNPVGSGVGANIQWMYNWSGQEWLNAQRTDVTVDSPAAIKMLTYWAEMVHIRKLTPHPGGPPARGDRLAGGYAMWQEYMTMEVKASWKRFFNLWRV